MNHYYISGEKVKIQCTNGAINVMQIGCCSCGFSTVPKSV
jgi:hypothetical protein